jgi:hypothetical protein
MVPVPWVSLSVPVSLGAKVRPEVLSKFIEGRLIYQIIKSIVKMNKYLHM